MRKYAIISKIGLDFIAFICYNHFRLKMRKYAITTGDLYGY